MSKTDLIGTPVRETVPVRFFHVRPMTEADAQSVVQLSAQLAYQPSLSQVSERIVRLAAEAADNGLFVCCFTDDGNVVGWIHVYGVQLLESAKYAEIGGLVVDAANRRQGHGRRLVEAAETWAAEWGFASLRLRSGQQREEEAHRFYRSIGYEAARISTLFRKEL